MSAWFLKQVIQRHLKQESTKNLDFSNLPSPASYSQIYQGHVHRHVSLAAHLNSLNHGRMKMKVSLKCGTFLHWGTNKEKKLEGFVL